MPAKPPPSPKQPSDGNKPRGAKTAQSEEEIAQKTQRSWVNGVKKELKSLHETSLVLMKQHGVLPPFYGNIGHDGAYSEILPIWNIKDNTPDELALLLFRASLVDDINPELEDARLEVKFKDTWEMSDLLTLLNQYDSDVVVEGKIDTDWDRFAFVLPTKRLMPAPGYDLKNILQAIVHHKPYAVFLHFPITGDGDTFDCAWQDWRHVYGHILYGKDQANLEAAVWRYRINLAVYLLDKQQEAATHMKAHFNPRINLSDFAAGFDHYALRAYRVYGTTSPLREKQLELDILREDTDLVIPLPLKLGIEPLESLEQNRAASAMRLKEASDLAPTTLFRFPIEKIFSMEAWTQIRSHKYYCLRPYIARLQYNRQWETRLMGYYTDRITISWVYANTLDELFNLVDLLAIQELLTITRFMKPRIRQLLSDEQP
jgi:hypothetical protein